MSAAITNAVKGNSNKSPINCMKTNGKPLTPKSKHDNHIDKADDAIKYRTKTPAFIMFIRATSAIDANESL